MLFILATAESDPVARMKSAALSAALPHLHPRSTRHVGTWHDRDVVSLAGQVLPGLTGVDGLPNDVTLVG